MRRHAASTAANASALGGARMVYLVGVEAQREAEVALARGLAARGRVEAEATARAASLAQHKLHSSLGAARLTAASVSPAGNGGTRRRARATRAAPLRARRAATGRGLAPWPPSLGCLA